jgi:ubiquinone/menaquinone biosynthesis C-methylase UbiE
MWGKGPYERITATIRDVHELLVDRLAPEPGVDWLDAACGTGAVAFLAAERGATVLGMDFAPALIDTARTLAARRGSLARFEVADAEAMPYEGASFDVISSSFGVMFAPDHEAVAGELGRVTRRGGRIGLATWTLEGVIADQFRVIAPFLPPPPEGAGSPFSWGSEERVQSLLGEAFELAFEHHATPLRLVSGAAHWELFSTSFGPVKALTESLDEERLSDLRNDWIAWAESMRQGDEIVQQREYLLVLGRRR